jgi:DNA-binding NarL/FixJ family response regulator
MVRSSPNTRKENNGFARITTALEILTCSQTLSLELTTIQADQNDGKWQAMISVSIIEDDPSVRRIMASWVSDAPGLCCAGVHAHAAQALARMPAEKPDVVLVDINLPDQSGIECVWQLKPLLPMTQFILLTVYHDSEQIFQALEAGATGCLLKRLSREELTESVRKIHQGDLQMPIHIAHKILSSFPAVRESSPKLIPPLSSSDRAIIERLARGYSRAEISGLLGITVAVINSHIRCIYAWLRAQSRDRARSVTPS